MSINVRIFVDAVINHMAGMSREGVGSGGCTYFTTRIFVDAVINHMAGMSREEVGS
jgi:hypothetical protein